MKFFFSKLTKNYYFVTIVVFFLLAVGFSYWFVGFANSSSRFWKKAASVLPLPVVIVNDNSIGLEAVKFYEKIGATDPINSTIRLAALENIAKNENIFLSDNDINEKLSILKIKYGEDWNNFTANKQVTETDIKKYIITPDLLTEKIAKKNTTINNEVILVEEKLKQDEMFNEVAQKYSDDIATSELGGDIGFISENEINKDVYNRALKLKEGEWSGPIQIAEGYIFVKRLETQRKTLDNPERTHLNVIFIQTFNFENWFSDQVKSMKTRVLI